jgi:hypothetical protein
MWSQRRATDAGVVTARPGATRAVRVELHIVGGYAGRLRCSYQSVGSMPVSSASALAFTGLMGTRRRRDHIAQRG